MKNRLTQRRHPAVNITTGFFAAILSILLVLMVLITALYSSITTMIKPENLTNITTSIINATIQGVDSETLIADNEVVKENIEELGIPAETVSALLESNACKEVIGLYTQDIADLMAGKEVTGSLTADALRQIVNDNVDEVVEIAVQMTGETEKKEELKSKIMEAVDKEADRLVDSLPDAQTLVEPLIQSDAFETIRLAINPMILWIALGVCLLFAGLIYALRCYRFEGLLWIGVDVALAGILLGIVNASINSPLVTDLLTEMAEDMLPVMSAVTSVYATGLLLRVILVVALAALFIGGFIALFVTVLKKNPVVKQPLGNATADATPPVTAVQEVAPNTDTDAVVTDAE